MTNNYIDGEKLKKRREALGLSQRQVSIALDCSESYVSRLESTATGTDCGINYALRLASALQTTVKKLTSAYSGE